MEDFLRKIKLFDTLKIELNTSRIDFVNILSSKVDSSDLGMFSDIGDIFSSSKNEYKGIVSHGGFKIKRKHRLFDTKLNSAKANGKYRELNDKLVVDIEINGLDNRMYIFFGFVIVFYLIIFSVFIFSDFDGQGPGLFVTPFILLHAAFMLGIPYFIMKRGVKKLKYDLERELHFLIQSNKDNSNVIR